MGEAEIPNILSGLKIWTLLWSICMWKPSHKFSPWAPLSQSEPNEACRGRLWICPWHQGRKTSIDGKTWSFTMLKLSVYQHIFVSVYSGSQLTSFFLNVQFAEPKACPAGTRHDKWLATQISGFLKTTQLCSSLNFISMMTVVESDFTKFLSDCDHDQSSFFFLTTIFPDFNNVLYIS